MARRNRNARQSLSLLVASLEAINASNESTRHSPKGNAMYTEQNIFKKE